MPGEPSPPGRPHRTAPPPPPVSSRPRAEPAAAPPSVRGPSPFASSSALAAAAKPAQHLEAGRSRRETAGRTAVRRARRSSRRVDPCERHVERSRRRAARSIAVDHDRGRSARGSRCPGAGRGATSAWSPAHRLAASPAGARKSRSRAAMRCNALVAGSTRVRRSSAAQRRHDRSAASIVTPSIRSRTAARPAPPPGRAEPGVRDERVTASRRRSRPGRPPARKPAEQRARRRGRDRPLLARREAGSLRWRESSRPARRPRRARPTLRRARPCRRCRRRS